MMARPDPGWPPQSRPWSRCGGSGLAVISVELPKGHTNDIHHYRHSSSLLGQFLSTNIKSALLFKQNASKTKQISKSRLKGLMDNFCFQKVHFDNKWVKYSCEKVNSMVIFKCRMCNHQHKPKITWSRKSWKSRKSWPNSWKSCKTFKTFFLKTFGSPTQEYSN